MKIIRYTKKSRQQLRALPQNEARRVATKIQELAGDIENNPNVKKLKGQDGYRLRVGKWRVLFDDDGTIIEIYHIGSRGSVYKK